MADFPFDEFNGIRSGDNATLNNVKLTQITFPNGSVQTTAGNTFVVNNDLSSEFVNKIKKLEKIVNDLTLEKKTKPEKKILFGKDRILKKKISV